MNTKYLSSFEAIEYIRNLNVILSELTNMVAKSKADGTYSETLRWSFNIQLFAYDEAIYQCQMILEKHGVIAHWADDDGNMKIEIKGTADLDYDEYPLPVINLTNHD